MMTSESINEIAGALAKAQAKMGGAIKDAENPYFKSKYADLASVWDACRGPLTDNGIAVVQSPSAEGPCVHVDTLLTHTSGQWMRGTVSVTAKDDSPQAVGSAITYLRRYALQSFAGVAPEDDDAESAQPRNGKANGNGHAKPQAAQSVHVATGDVGPMVVEKIGPARAGAMGEVFFTNGDAILTYKKPVLTAAAAALRAGHSVIANIKSSQSGNRYLEEVKSTGMTAAELAATKFTPDAPITEKDIPF